MIPFTLHNPVTLHFGENCLNDLNKTAKTYGKKVLLIYGKSSIKSSGLYEQIVKYLPEFELIEYSGIKSNPLYEDVDKAAEIGRKENVDLILAVGGGSVIDSAKMTSIAIPVNHSVWDFYSKGEKPKKSIPVITVLTLAATGTEMNPYAVLQNTETGEKRGFGSPYTYPKHSFLDPELTKTVPANYTSYGIVDLIAHSLEQYFGEGNSSLSDKFVFSVIKEAIEYGPQLMNDLANVELRSKIMWSATVALNGWLNIGRKSGDWGVHGIEHSLSVLYDIPHGAGLSICYPAWLKVMSKRIPDRIIELGQNVFNVSSCEETILKFEEFFQEINSPIRLNELNITSDKTEEILKNMSFMNVSGMHHSLDKEAHEKIVHLLFS